MLSILHWQPINSDCNFPLSFRPVNNSNFDRTACAGDWKKFHEIFFETNTAPVVTFDVNDLFKCCTSIELDFIMASTAVAAFAIYWMYKCTVHTHIWSHIKVIYFSYLHLSLHRIASESKSSICYEVGKMYILFVAIRWQAHMSYTRKCTAVYTPRLLFLFLFFSFSFLSSPNNNANEFDAMEKVENGTQSGVLVCHTQCYISYRALELTTCIFCTQHIPSISLPSQLLKMAAQISAISEMIEDMWKWAKHVCEKKKYFHGCMDGRIHDPRWCWRCRCTLCIVLYVLFFIKTINAYVP